MRATAHCLPYHRLPLLMIVELVAMAKRCLNGFPRDDGVSEHMSPHSRVTRWARMDYNKLPLEFGSYVQLFDRSVNTIRSRTIGAIALNPMGDETGTYCFMSLKTGQVLTKGPGTWTEVPITDIAIARVEALAKREGQPMIQDSNLLVDRRPNQPFDEDDEYNDNYEPSIIDGEDDIELEIDDVSENTNGGSSVTQDLSQLDLLVTEPVPKQITHSQVEDDGIDTLVKDKAKIEEESATCIAEEEGADHVEEEGAVLVEEEGASTNMNGGSNNTGNSEGVTQGAYNLRPNRSREYSHRFHPQVYDVTNMHASHAPQETVNVDQRMFGFVFTQMSAWAGIKKHGQAAHDAITAEFAQLDYKGAYELIHATDLTETQQTSALRIINLIKKK